MRIALSVLFSLALSFNSWSQIRFIKVKEFQDYQSVLTVAQQNNSLLLMAIHSEEGNFKKMFFNGVFEDQNLQNATRDLVVLAISTDDEMGQRFQEVFSLTTTPAFVVMNDEELFLDVLNQGYVNAADLSKFINQAKAKKGRYALLTQAYQEHRLDDATWFELIDIYGLNFSFEETTRLALEYLNAKPSAELLQGKPLSILTQYGVDLETPYPQLVINNVTDIQRQQTDFDLEVFSRVAYNYNLNLAIANQDSILLEKISEQLIPRIPDASEDSLRLNLHLNYAQLTNRYASLLEFLGKRGRVFPASELADLLYEEAYALVEDSEEMEILSGAHLLAEESIRIEANFKNQMLSAYTLYLMQKYPEAEEKLRQAVRFADTAERLRSATKLQNLIEEKS